MDRPEVAVAQKAAADSGTLVETASVVQIPVVAKASSDSGTLVETADVAEIQMVAKASSDIGRLVESRWVGQPPQAGGSPPSVRSASTGSNGTAPYTVNKPAGVVHNDILIAIQAADRGTTANMTAPTGGATWNLLDSVDGTTPDGAIQVIRLWWKRAGSSEPSTYSFNQRSGSDGTCLIVAVKDASLSAAPQIVRGVTSGSGPAVPTPGITPSSGSDLELRFIAVYPEFGAAITPTPPAGLTGLATSQSRTYTAVAAAARQLQSGAATGTENFTVSTVLLWLAGFTVAIAPGNAGPQQVDKSAFDDGTLVETSTVADPTVSKLGSDTGTLGEVSAVTADVASLDTATLGEVVAVDVETGSADSAALVETSMLEVGWAGVDEATLTETAHVDVQVMATDSATLVESAVIDETIGPVSGDHGVLVEAVQVDVQTAATDSGVLVESAEVVVLKEASDSGSLVESVLIGLVASDSGTFVESAQVEASVTATDSGVFADQSVVEAPKFATDSGRLLEKATVTDLGRDIAVSGLVYRRWSAGSPYRKYSAGEPRRAWGAGSPRT